MRLPETESKTAYFGIRMGFFFWDSGKTFFFSLILKHFDREKEGKDTFGPRIKLFISAAWKTYNL